MTEDRLRHVLAQLVNWRKRAPNGDLVPAYPPPVLLKNVLATPDPALPVLAGIVTAPVFGNDGTLITEPGYHPATRLLYEPAQSFTLPPIAERPTPTEIAAARSLCSTTCSASSPSSTKPSAHTLWRSCCCPSSVR